MNATDHSVNYDRHAILLTIPAGFVAIAGLIFLTVGRAVISHSPWLTLIGSISILGSIDGIPSIWRGHFHLGIKVVLTTVHLLGAFFALSPLILLVLIVLGGGL